MPHIVSLKFLVYPVVLLSVKAFNSYISKLDLGLHSTWKPHVRFRGLLFHALSPDEGSATVPAISDSFRFVSKFGFGWESDGVQMRSITISYPENAARSAENAFQVFSGEFTTIVRLTSLRWTSGELRRHSRWSSRSILGVPASLLGI